VQDEEAGDTRSEVGRLERESGTAARLFDVRTVIGGLFVVYGLLVGAAGIAPSAAALDKAQGVNINLWTGLGMLVLGLAFLLWLRLRPLGAAREEPGAGQPGGDQPDRSDFGKDDSGGGQPGSDQPGR
jgi:hypothetical protein